MMKANRRRTHNANSHDRTRQSVWPTRTGKSNPVHATGVEALASTPERLREALKPLVSGISHVSTQVSMRFEDYIDYLELLTEPAQEPEDQEAAWFRRVASFKKRQRAYGPATTLKAWLTKRGWQRMGDALPE